jgi:CRP-like cAMP-binding protein
MVHSNLIIPQWHSSTLRTFKRRESIPLNEGILWRIETGAARCFTLSDEGTIISLGFWAAGDIIGQPLSRIQPYQVECLADVAVYSLLPSECWDLNQVMLSHIHQMQELLRIRSGPIQQRLRQFLEWLAYKFGRETNQGALIELRLTHQDMADVVGTTRVTITRLLHQLERDGEIECTRQHQILLYHH